MTDDKRHAGDGSAASPVAGERLAEARRLKQISLPDVARQLHLDEPRVQALEENRFDVLGAPVFAKGYLRKYAKLVGVSTDDIMADYYTLNRATGAPPVVGPVRKRRPVIDPGPWIVGLLAVIALAGATYWWMQQKPDAPPPGIESRVPATPSVDDAPAREQRPLPEETSPQAVPDTDLQTAVPPATVPVPDRTEAVEETPAAPAGNEIELRLSYSGDCWTEVSDANGRRLFFELGSAGQTVTVRGTAPLRVLVGNEENVRLTVNGAPYTITEANRRGNTARFSIRQ